MTSVRDASPSAPDAPPNGRRARRAARHKAQASTAAARTLQLAAFRAAEDDRDDAPARAGALPGGLLDFHAAVTARLSDQRDRGAVAARIARLRAAGGLTDPHSAAAADTVPSPDGGSPRKPKSSVAAPAGETPSDLRKEGSADGSELPSEMPDLGEQYEQRNNKLQRRMRLLDEARALSVLPSLRKCGIAPIGGAVAITQHADGKGGFAGLFRCGSVWSCPECMPIVRSGRAATMEQYAYAWATEHDAALCNGDDEVTCDEDGKPHTHEGHGMAMATLTSRHSEHAVLEDRVALDKNGEVLRDAKGKAVIRPGQLQRTADAWRSILQSRWWRQLKADYGIAGATRALEVTHSWNNGWHTHIHAVLWFWDVVTDQVAEAVQAELYERWEAKCRAAGLGRPSKKHGVKVDPARRGAEGAADIARYLVKVQDKDEDKPAANGDLPVNEMAKPVPAELTQKLDAARARRDAARAGRDRAAEAAADFVIADLREQIGKAERARALGNELLRGDLKTGRKSGRTPMEILRLALAGDEAERELWNEFERATKGSRMLTWTGDARDRLVRLTGIEERDGQEVVAGEDRKAKAVLLQVEPRPFKDKVGRVPGRRGQLRLAVTVVSTRAIEAGLDAPQVEEAARKAVAEVLDSWGMTRGLDYYGPGDRKFRPETGEIRADVARIEPQERPALRRPSWHSPGALEADAVVFATRPRDLVRPEQARRRAAGLPIAREKAAATTATARPRTSAPRCACGIKLAPQLVASGRHPGC